MRRLEQMWTASYPWNQLLSGLKMLRQSVAVFLRLPLLC
jgi:hypothetical protein